MRIAINAQVMMVPLVIFAEMAIFMIYQPNNAKVVNLDAPDAHLRQLVNDVFLVFHSVMKIVYPLRYAPKEQC